LESNIVLVTKGWPLLYNVVALSQRLSQKETVVLQFDIFKD